VPRIGTAANGVSEFLKDYLAAGMRIRIKRGGAFPGLIKKPPGIEPGGFESLDEKLLFDNVDGGKTFGAFFHVKFHMIAFGQGAESTGADSGMMHKYIITIFTLDKPKTFAIIKPFYCSF
jgi:hypothetical protein